MKPKPVEGALCPDPSVERPAAGIQRGVKPLLQQVG